MAGRFFSADEARLMARSRLPRMMFDFVDGAAGDESLRDINSRVIDAIRLMPRVLADVAIFPTDLWAWRPAVPSALPPWACAI